jgi:hypothetical protein
MPIDLIKSDEDNTNPEKIITNNQNASSTS